MGKIILGVLTAVITIFDFFKDKKEISRIKKAIKIGIFVMAVVLVSIVANFFYIHTTNTRLDKVEKSLAEHQPKNLKSISSSKK